MDSKRSENSEFGQIYIPSSLRTVQPFLDDAQKFMRFAKNKSGPGAIKFKRIAISCINAAFKVSKAHFLQFISCNLYGRR